MPQALSALAATVLVVLFLLRRSRPPLLASVDVAAVAALNRAQLTLVQPVSPTAATVPDAAPDTSVQLPLSARGRRDLALHLAKELRADTRRRRAAMQLCSRWHHAGALPWLRRGLRDPDPEVMRLAAEALARYRRQGAATPTSSLQALALPRNVSRTR